MHIFIFYIFRLTPTIAICIILPVNQNSHSQGRVLESIGTKNLVKAQQHTAQ